MDLHWEDGFEIGVRIENGAAVLAANRAGLRSLAGIFAALAEEPPVSHVHLDAFNALEDGAAELIVEHVDG